MLVFHILLYTRSDIVTFFYCDFTFYQFEAKAYQVSRNWWKTLECKQNVPEIHPLNSNHFQFLYRWTWIWRTTVRRIFAYMTDNMLGASPMHIKYLSYVSTDFAYDGPIFLVPLSLSYLSSPVQCSEPMYKNWSPYHLDAQMVKSHLSGHPIYCVRNSLKCQF